MMVLHRIAAQKKGCCPVLGAEQFARRIMGNYELFWIRITAEDFIHAMLVPYENGGEAGHTQAMLLQDIKIKQQASLYVVNQLVNRLQYAAQGRQSYQDMVFVQAVLRKLGISNQKELIYLIIKTAGISLQKHEIVRLLNGTRQMFTGFSKELHGRQSRFWKRKKAKEENREMKGRCFLHHAVWERLGLLEQYQDWQAMYVPQWREAGNVGVDYAQAMENMGYANSLFVSQLNEAVFGIKETDMLQSFNPYEKWTASNEALSLKGLQSAFISAVLVNLAKHTALYEEGLQSMLPGRKRLFWLNVGEAALKSSRITAERFFFYHRAMKAADIENQRALMEVIQDGFTREARILYSIRDMTGRQDYRTDKRELYKIGNTLKKILSERQETLREEMLFQTGRMLHLVTRMEEDIHRYLYYTDVHYVDENRRLQTQYAELVHIRQEGDWTRQDNKERRSENRRKMEQEAAFSSMEYTDRKSIHMDLSGQSRRALSRLVKDNISEQMNVLTDKVYERLEHRLESEKKRRGY